MIPILFEYDETDYTAHGIGDLVDCIECKAQQTAEGEYELSFSYPYTGALFSELQINRQILAKTNDYDQCQPFRIYGIEDSINGTVTVNCQHISYDLTNYPVKIFKDAISPDQVIGLINSNRIVIDPKSLSSCPFTITAYNIPIYSSGTYAAGDFVIHENNTWQAIENITVAEAWNNNHWIMLEKFQNETPTSIRSLLIDGDNSILGYYGGDITFDRYQVDISKSAGKDRGIVIEYGIDLMDFSQDKNISETVTGVFPFWKGNIRNKNEKDNFVAVTFLSEEKFKPGVSYYERTGGDNYFLTTDQRPDGAKAYFIKNGNTYRSITLSDLTFDRITQYYEHSTIKRYTGSYDPSDTYYVLENGNYRQITISDMDFKLGVPYYNLGYYQTSDTEKSISKIYFVLENGSYREVELTDLEFKTGITYYEYGYKPTSDTEYVPYDPSQLSFKKYYVYDNGTYRVVEMKDLDFKSGVVYYEEDYDSDSDSGVMYEDEDGNIHYGEITYVPTTDAHYDPTKTYFYRDGDTYSFITLYNLDFKSGTTYYEDPSFYPTQDTKYNPNKTYYVEYDTSKYRSINTSDMGFKSGVQYYEEGYYLTSDERYDSTKVYYVMDSTGTYYPMTLSDMDFKSGTTYYTATYVITGDLTYNPSKVYYIFENDKYVIITQADMAFQPTLAYYELSSATISYHLTTDSTPQANKIYYVNDKITDEEKIVYGDVQYASSYTNLKAAAQRIEPLDLSEFFDAEEQSQLPTAAQLNQRAKQYMLANNVGEPTIDLTVSYATLGQDVRLYDAITVKLPKYGIDVKAKVTTYTYDVLNERCVEIEVSNAKASSAWTSLEDASRLRKGVIPPQRIGSKSITSEQIGTAQVGSSNIATGGVGTPQIQSLAVTDTKIADKAVVVNKIADGAVDSVKLADLSVSEQKLVNQAVALGKLSSGVQATLADLIIAKDIYATVITSKRSVSCSTLIVSGHQYVYDSGGWVFTDGNGNTRRFYGLRLAGT